MYAYEIMKDRPSSRLTNPQTDRHEGLYEIYKSNNNSITEPQRFKRFLAESFYYNFEISLKKCSNRSIEA